MKRGVVVAVVQRYAVVISMCSYAKAVTIEVLWPEVLKRLAVTK